MAAQSALDVRDAGLLALIANDAAFEQLGTGFIFTEGPVWHPVRQTITFSDMPGDVMRQWSAAGGIEVVRQPCSRGPRWSAGRSERALLAAQAEGSPAAARGASSSCASVTAVSRRGLRRRPRSRARGLPMMGSPAGAFPPLASNLPGPGPGPIVVRGPRARMPPAAVRSRSGWPGIRPGPCVSNRLRLAAARAGCAPA